MRASNVVQLFPRAARSMTVEESASQLEELVGKVQRKKRSPMSRRQVERATDEMNAMRATKDWGAATPKHLVALWAWCHASIYGVFPEEARSPAEFGRACMRAGQMLRQSFPEGGAAQAVEMMRWVWTREKARWGKPDANRDRRISWALQFSGSMVGDWRVCTAGRKLLTR